MSMILGPSHFLLSLISTTFFNLPVFMFAAKVQDKDNVDWLHLQLMLMVVSILLSLTGVNKVFILKAANIKTDTCKKIVYIMITISGACLKFYNSKA